MTCTFFGDIENNLAIAKKKLHSCVEVLINQGYSHFLVSNIGLFHAIAMCVCVELKKEHQIKITHICPNKKNLDDTKFLIKSLFQDINVKTYENLENKDTIHNIIEHMIDECDFVLFCFDETCENVDSDIEYAFNYAKSMNKDYKNITV